MKSLLITSLFFSSFAFAKSDFLPNQFSVEIEQVYKRFGKGKEVRTPFLLEYSYPSKMKYFNKKNKSLFVSNKTKSWYYVPSFLKSRPGTVKVNSGDSVRLVSVFDSLKSGLVSNKTYTVKKESHSHYKLTFEAKAQKQFNVKTADLYISNQSVKKAKSSSPFKNISSQAFTLNDLDRILIEYRDKKNLTLEFKRFNTQAAFEPGHFSFAIPENTKIIK